MKFKNFLLVLTIIGVPLSGAPFAYAHESHNEAEHVRVEVFISDDCAQCEEEKIFLDDLLTKRDDIAVFYHDISSPETEVIFDEFIKIERLAKVTPVTLVGVTVLQGFESVESTGVEIQSLIDVFKNHEPLSLIQFMMHGGSGIKSAVPVSENCGTEAGCVVGPTAPRWNPGLPILIAGILLVITMLIALLKY